MNNQHNNAKHILEVKSRDVFCDCMYPYHNRIKQRIKNGELTGFEFAENYGNIGECLLLFFSTPPFIRPVRPHKYAEYTELLKSFEQKKKDGK